MTEKREKFRHEYKYLISDCEMEVLKARIDAIAKLDANVNRDGLFRDSYNIRSLYFDDLSNTCYMENESGTDPREKFRIRIYNHSDVKITLELKSKRFGMCMKESCPLTRAQCDILLNGHCLPDDESYPALLKKLNLQIKTRGLHPVVIVEYDRIPYVYPQGNVRITFDLNISASSQCMEFFEERLSLRPILPVGQHVMEVKWDAYLPDFIYHTMSLPTLRRSSFSKFYLCRRFTH